MKSLYYICFLALVIACSSPKNSNQTPVISSVEDKELDKTIRRDTTVGKYQYSVLFARVQDRVMVYVNDQEVFNSGLIEDSESLPIRVGLDQYVTSGVNDIKIELYNDPNASGKDTSAEVYFELFRGRDPVDFAHEVSKTADMGLVLERTFQLAVD